MARLKFLKSVLVGSASAFVLVSAAQARNFDVPSGDLDVALATYSSQSGIELLVSAADIKGIRTKGVVGDLSANAALSHILAGTGFVVHRNVSGKIGIAREDQRSEVTPSYEPAQAAPVRLATATAAGIESVVVTSSKIKGDIQTVPIAITALSQEQLTSRQIAGGPDLVKEVPNLTFSKTNFTGYNIQIRGIGTQAISVTTDPAVAVAFNDMPFLRNHFFEQEFYDVSQVEVLRGPQGTLYGRNATAGVVNVISATPTDQFEAMLSADFGNYHNRRYEGMVNIPIVDDRLDLRIAGEWTKRDGYTTDTTYNAPIDGRDLWSSRATVGWKPASDVQTYLVWEHFQESDDRLRSGKQLCKTDYGPGFVPTDLSNPYPGIDHINGGRMGLGPGAYAQFSPGGDNFTQGCLPDVSMYSPQAFGAPLGYALPYALGAEDLGYGNPLNPYASVTQSTNLRDIESSILPTYRAKNDTLEFNANWNVTPALTFTSQTGYNNDFLWSSEDFNRFGSTPGFFAYPLSNGGTQPDPSGLSICSNIFQSDCGAGIPIGSPCPNGSYGGGCTPAGYVCDPQLGCSDRLIVEDLSTERAWQFSQEFRLASNFSGPLNFTAGGNFLHYETFEKYYVFSNVLTLISTDINVESCLTCAPHLHYGYRYNPLGLTSDPTGGYIDPNSLSSLNDQGHNYYLNNNPYVLNSYALFGEANYNLTNDLKLTGGLRWTDDQKHFLEMPSWVATWGYGYPVASALNQGWERFTGRAVANWTPQLDFTDQTLVYASYAHGYKAGGANPPRAQFTTGTDFVHPLTFKPEYIEAFELGSKNTLLDGALTLNGDVFYYNYTGYQISEIVDRTAINTNFNAHVEGAELESKWEPAPGLSFNLAAGYENTALNKGEAAVDLMDRTAGHPGWYVYKPYVTEASNCVFPGYVAEHLDLSITGGGPQVAGYCTDAYVDGNDPVAKHPYVPYPFGPGNYPGFDPRAGTPGDPYTGQNTGDLCVQNCDGTGTPAPVYTTVDFGPAPNNGAGFAKNLGGKQLPNAPHFTVSLAGQYTMPISTDWAATFHTDFYWQSQSWARVFDDPIDKIHGYMNVNLSLILTSAGGWQVMGYLKNVFNKTAITGTFLNSDDTGLTTNIFLTDPRLFGVRITKNFDGSGLPGVGDLFSNSDADDKKPQVWLTLGGGFDQLSDAEQTFAPPFYSMFSAPLGSPAPFQHPPRGSFDYDARLAYQPEDSDWMVSASIRYGRTARRDHVHESNSLGKLYVSIFGNERPLTPPNANYFDAFNSNSESHEIVDFAVGKEVGLGMFGLHGSSELNGGVRFVQFNQSSNASIHGDPKFVFHTLGPKYHYNDSATEQASRRFHGIGPSLSWNASTPVTDSGDAGGISLDWGVNAAVLFGRQTARVHHQTNGAYACFPLLNGGCHHGSYSSYGTHYVNGYGNAPAYKTHYQHSGPARGHRSRSVMVPNLGGFAGISWRYSNAKVSFGYRADEFFGAMDGGLDSHKSYNLGLFGPYANISLGFGG